MANKTFYGYRFRAEAMGLECTLSKAEAFELFKQACAYCGAEPQNRSTNRNGSSVFVYNGIDRRDSGQGYTRENCVSCCWQCNRAKSGDTFEVFSEWVKRCYERLSELG